MYPYVVLILFMNINVVNRNDITLFDLEWLYTINTVHNTIAKYRNEHDNALINLIYHIPSANLIIRGFF